MARDGSGTYSLPATMATSGATASSVTVNSIMNDLAQALTDSINKDGTKAFAANQSMGSNKLTNLAAATALTDAAQYSQVQKGNVAQAATVAGTVDAITLAFSPTITSYTTGMRIRWTSGGANTVTAPTLNIDSLGVKTIKKNPASTALAVGDLGTSGTILEAVYNGTDFILLNPPGAVAATVSVRGTVEMATAAEIWANTSDRAVSTDYMWAAMGEVTLTDAATVAVDMGTFINAVLTIGGNRTLGAPTNTKVGQSGCIRILQDATGSRTLAFHANYVFEGGVDPTLSTPAGTQDLLFYYVVASNFIYCHLVKAVS